MLHFTTLRRRYKNLFMWSVNKALYFAGIFFVDDCQPIFKRIVSIFHHFFNIFQCFVDDCLPIFKRIVSIFHYFRSIFQYFVDDCQPIFKRVVSIFHYFFNIFHYFVVDDCQPIFKRVVNIFHYSCCERYRRYLSGSLTMLFIFFHYFFCKRHRRYLSVSLQIISFFLSIYINTLLSDILITSFQHLTFSVISSDFLII